MTLKEWRKAKGFTLQQLARLCNRRSKSTILLWEKKGINSVKIRRKLDIISDGQITNFEGEDGVQN